MTETTVSFLCKHPLNANHMSRLISCDTVTHGFVVHLFILSKHKYLSLVDSKLANYITLIWFYYTKGHILPVYFCRKIARYWENNDWTHTPLPSNRSWPAAILAHIKCRSISSSINVYSFHAFLLQVRNGHIKRITDNDIQSLVLEIVGTNVRYEHFMIQLSCL